MPRVKLGAQTSKLLFLKKQKLVDKLKNFWYNIYKKIQKVFSTIESKGSEYIDN